MTQREKDINNIINSIKTQETWENERKIYIKQLYDKYNKELEHYSVIENFDNIKLGGYIRYINSDDKLKWGGILLKKYKKYDYNYMILANSNMQRINVSYNHNTCFYKTHRTAADNRRQFFMSYLDKIE